jgi:hypothetical protein
MHLTKGQQQETVYLFDVKTSPFCCADTIVKQSHAGVGEDLHLSARTAYMN